MSNSIFIDQLATGKTFISDGATGTNLQAQGLTPGEPPESWLLTKPEQIIKLHTDFIDAGADIILTNTFGATSIRLKQSNLGDRTKEINAKAVQCAKQAVNGRPIYIAGSIGPTGEMLKPLGSLEEEDAETTFAEQARLLVEAGVDLVVIETQFDMTEAKIAVSAVRSISDIPVVCSFSFDRGYRTMMGVKPEQMAKELTALDIDLIGINCGRSIEDNFGVLQEVQANTPLPIWFKPNAGLPALDDDGKSVYDLTPQHMASHVQEWINTGARVVGGCCGTSPEHLEQIARAAKQQA